MKAGTSSLHRYLDTHPDVGMSTTKETDWFLPERPAGHDLDWYRSQFDGRLEVRGETSPNYTKRALFPGVPARAHEVVPDARLVYVVRDPVERARSHVLHTVAEGRRDPDEVAALLRPRGPGRLILDASSYHRQLTAWLECWDLDDVHVVAAEDLREDRRATLAGVFRFLGVDDDHDSPEFDRVVHVTSEKFRADDAPDRPTLPPDLRDRLAEHLVDDVARFRTLTGREFPAWTL